VDENQAELNFTNASTAQITLCTRIYRVIFFSEDEVNANKAAPYVIIESACGIKLWSLSTAARARHNTGAVINVAMTHLI
jgi:hypothetical protein